MPTSKDDVEVQSSIESNTPTIASVSTSVEESSPQSLLVAPSPSISPAFANEDSNDSKVTYRIIIKKYVISLIFSVMNFILKCFQSEKVTVATQTGCEAPSEPPAAGASGDALATDPHCYECRVRYRDPRPRDLVMYLHAWKYKVYTLNAFKIETLGF